ncbi:DUF1769-domain-containing protein [Panus rudis PR-1116 ss-1]|nr:DUF1769-domain-containing protein [Panus rudis PR-1116 ss-1]
MPRFRVLAGPSLTSLQPIETNTDKAYDIKSDAFEGQVACYLKGLSVANAESGGDTKDKKGIDNAYFEHERRRDVTWSIQVQGRFLQPHNADDILFGNAFDHALSLPWGFSAAIAFMQYIDPTLEQDLGSQTKPWALSPLISTMPYLKHKGIDGELHKVPPFPPLEPIEEDVSELRIEDDDGREKMLEGAVERRSFFRDATQRKKVVFGPEDLLTVDFCYNYLYFNPDGVTLRIPGGLSFDMMRYWDGQPVRFICCERLPRGQTGKNGEPWGRIFWCVAIEVVEEESGKKEEHEEDEDEEAPDP